MLNKDVFPDYKFIATDEGPNENIERHFETSLSLLILCLE